MRRRGLGYQQQCYANDGMRIDTQSQQQSYAFQEEAWSSKNDYHKHFSGSPMHMKPGANSVDLSKQHGVGKFGVGGGHGMLQESWHHGGHPSFDHGLNGSNAYHHHGSAHGRKKLPFGGTNVSHFSNNTGANFNSSSNHTAYYSEEEESECETYREEHYGPATVKVDESNYEHHYAGGDANYANPYGGTMKGMKSHGRNVYWAVKGV